MKNKIVLLVTAIAVLGFMFKSQITDLFCKEDIKGCMDPLASNYDPKATEDNDSCDFEIELSADLFNKIEILKTSDWDVIKYTNLRNDILFYFTSLKQSNSGQQNISLNKLDMAYMVVLGKATDNEILNCFKSSSKLKKEVRTFYDKYKSVNKSIKGSQYGFNSYSQIDGYKKKVNKLLAKRFVKADFDQLKNKISSFSTSRGFLQFKQCKNLTSKISDAISDLDKYEKIEKEYNKFDAKYGAHVGFFKRKDYVDSYYFDLFEDYQWYYDTVSAADARLRDYKQKSTLKNRLKNNTN